MNRPRHEDGLFGSNFYSTSGTSGMSSGTLHGNSYYNPNVSQSFSTSNHYQHQYGHGSGNQSGVEPMHMSPVSGSLSPGTAGGGADRVQYLPSYLLGEPSKSPKGKLRKELMTPSLDLSNVSAVQQNSFAGASGQFSTSYSIQSPKTPPASNLFSSNKGPVSTSTPTASLQKAGPPKHGLGSVAGAGLAITPTKSTPVEESGRAHWITVFGFQPANQSYVLQTFATIGSIVEYKANPGCNWIHIRYSSSIEARKALFKNGSVLGGAMMIGVMKFDGQTGLTGGTGTPTVVSVSAPTSAGDAQAENSVKSRIRPLASDNMMNQIPVRESGLISKVSELFGW